MISQCHVCGNNGIGKSTVSDIKKNKKKILAFSCEMVDMGMKKQAKVMKLSDDRRLDQAVFLWFRQKRSEGVPKSGPLLCKKALELSRILQGEELKFKASEGWKWGFCKRHGIRQLAFQGEKLSADKELQISLSQNLGNLLRRNFHVIKYSTVMKLVSTTVSCQNLLLHQVMKNLLMEGKNLRIE